MGPRALTYAAAVVVLAGAGSARADDVEAVTRPSQDVTLSFVRPGRIATIAVKEGRQVAAGDVLVQQDDRAEQAQLAQLKAQVDSTVRIEASQAQLDQKKADHEKIQIAFRRKVASKLEVEHARLDVTIAELSLKLQEFEHAQNRRRYEEAKLQLDRMTIRSPIAGKVERVHVEAGESVDALQEVVRIVSIDPLWIEAPVPLARARRLAVGDPAAVTAEDGSGRVDGKITHIASVADAASDTLRVRVEAPNPTGRPAGERVRVDFSPAAKAGRTQGSAAPGTPPAGTDKKE